MGNNKKAKIMTRIIAGVLVLIMALGLIIPYVSASEMDEYAPLPDGVHYEERDGEQVPIADEGKNIVPIKLEWVAKNPSIEEIVIFVANLTTREVQVVEFSYYNGYVGTIKAAPGYYAAYANDVAWEVEPGMELALNSGAPYFFSIGDDMEKEINGNQITPSGEFLKFLMDSAPDTYDVVVNEAPFFVTSDMQEFPSMLEDMHKALSEPEQNTTPPEETVPPDDDAEEEDSGYLSTIGSLGLNMLKQSIGLILVVVVCGIVVVIIKKKREEQEYHRSESDRYDDTSVR